MAELEFQPVNVIGMGMSPEDLTASHRDLIGAAEVLVGGRRHLASFPNSPARRITIDRDLAAVAAEIKAEMASRRVVVLASGDPLFFGIGAYLIKALGRRQVRIWPNVNAVAAAFARIGRSWNDAVVVSLHGRQDKHQLRTALGRGGCLAVFTDHRHSPAWLADFVIAQGHAEARFCILERMGYEDERVNWLAPAEAATQTFREPNLVVIESNHEKKRENPYLGLPETQIAHERGLITKSEVRAVSLSKMQLKPQMVVWDLGAGSGAVAIEASVLVCGGRVCAVEKDKARVAQIQANCRKWGAAEVSVFEAELPDGMDDLPDPDRVFIGGGGKRLAAIIDRAACRLKTDGILVVNAVLLESMQAAVEAMRAQGLRTDITQIQISRSRPMATGERMEALNPVWIVRGVSSVEVINK